MRLWSLHPRYLDAKGLVALWREGLLAQKVLAGATGAYGNHPQLERFRAHPTPACAMASYLHAVSVEARRRGYRFDQSKINDSNSAVQAICVTDGQLVYELAHLTAKLEVRAPAASERLCGVGIPAPHPCFVVVRGPIASWERVKA